MLLQVCKSICSFFCLPAQYCCIVCVFNEQINIASIYMFPAGV